MAPGALEALSAQSDRWVRAALKADAWTPTGALHCELGFTLSASAPAIKELALRRAKLWLLPGDDLHRKMIFPYLHDGGATWGRLGSRLMRLWMVRDIWEHSTGTPPTYNAYKSYLMGVLESRSMSTYDQSRSQRRGILSHINICPNVSDMLNDARRHGLPIQTCGMKDFV